MKFLHKAVSDRVLGKSEQGSAPGDKSSSNMRTVLVSQWYAPEPVSVPILTAKELENAGFSVEVLTGIPNLPDGEVHVPYKAWKYYSEKVEGIRVRRAPLYPNHSSSALKRILNYLSWSASASFVGWKNLRKSDVNVVHCTPATAAIPALLARWTSGTPYVVIIQDLWPDTVSASGFVRNRWTNALISRLLGIVVTTIYRNAAQIVVISDGMGRTLEKRGFEADRITRVFNSVDETIFVPQERDADVRAQYEISEDSFLLVYAGNQGSAQNLAPLLRAVASLKGQGVELLLVGWGVERQQLQNFARENSADNIRFADRVSPTEVRIIQSAADLCVVSLKDDPLFRITIPSKLQTLLASGRPILGVVAGDPRDVIVEAGAGFVADPGSEESIRDAILEAQTLPSASLVLMGESGRDYYVSHMSSQQRSSALRRIVENARQVFS